MVPRLRTRFASIARVASSWLLGAFVAYLVAGNFLISTNALRRLVNSDRAHLVVAYRSGYTLYPGHLRLKDLELRFQDEHVAFALRLEDASCQVGLRHLVHHRFHATHVRATGASWRMLQKLKGDERRLAAFPAIEGFADARRAARGSAWSVRLDDIDAELNELWILEYRYLGKGRAHGGFELVPMQRLTVDPTTLTLRAGKLTVGEQTVSSSFSLDGAVSVAPWQIAPTRGALRPISGLVKLDLPIENLKGAELYLPGLQAAGHGSLSAILSVADGKLTSSSSVELQLGQLRLMHGRRTFRGEATAMVKIVTDENGKLWPVGHVELEGALTLPISVATRVTARLTGAEVDLALSTNDLVEGPMLAWLGAKIEEARVDDARAINAIVHDKLPFLVAPILGDGPFVISGSAELTADKTLVRLKEASLGDAAFSGAAQRTNEQWSGAAWGHMGVVPIGVRLKNDAVEAVPFTLTGWLETELLRVGIDPPPQG